MANTVVITATDLTDLQRRYVDRMVSKMQRRNFPVEVSEPAPKKAAPAPKAEKYAPKAESDSKPRWKKSSKPKGEVSGGE